MIFCHTGDNTELRVANPNLLPQSRRTDSATGLITCKFHRAFSIFKITNLLMLIIKPTYGYFCKFTSYSRFSLRQVSTPYFGITALTYCIPATVYGLLSHSERLFRGGCGFTFHGVVLGTTSYNPSVRQFILNLSI